MKKLLILVDKVGPKKELFAELISKRVSQKDIQVVLARFSDLYFELGSKGGSAEIEGMSLEEFELVYFRRAGDKFSGLAATLAVYLKMRGIKYIDTSWGEIGPLGSKFTSILKLAIAGLPVFPTIYVWQNNIDKYHSKIIKKFGLPLVAKELSTQGGKGVHLIKSKEDFGKLPLKDKRGGNNQYLFQKYVEIKNEYRVLILGKKAGVWEKKVVTQKGEFRHNIALGAEEEFLPIADIPAGISDVAIKAADILNVQIAGVDVATQKKTNKIFLVEVNRGPGVTYDTTLSPEIDEISKFLLEETQK